MVVSGYAVSDPALLSLSVPNQGPGLLTVQSINDLPFSAKEVFYTSSDPTHAGLLSVTGVVLNAPPGSNVVCELAYAGILQAANKPIALSLTSCRNVTALFFQTDVNQFGDTLFFDDLTLCGPGVTAAI